MFFLSRPKTGAVLGLSVIMSVLLFARAYAQDGSSELIRQQQRQQQFEQRFQPDVHVRLDGLKPHVAQSPEIFPVVESPCFVIHAIHLDGEQAARFNYALNIAVRQLGFQPGMCLGATSINRLMQKAQNRFIESGYVTSRIMASSQDLRSGALTLTVIPGLVGQIRVNDRNSEQTHSGRIRSWQNELPLASGEVLDLRSIEQGLENFKRLSTAEADIQIEPSVLPGHSDIVINWSQRDIPLRLTLSADDSGSRSSGKYQGSATLSLENPLGLSDLFYVSYNHSLGHTRKARNGGNVLDSGGTKGHAVHYSVPFGNWLFAFNQSGYRFDQPVAGYQQNYNYRGTSRNVDLGLTRLLYRDAHRKTTATLKGWTRRSYNFIDDTEIDVQRKRTAGWAAELNHIEYLGASTLNVKAGYKRGTGLFESEAPPEQAFGEGTSRMKVITADIGLMVPFSVGTQRFSYSSQWHGQWNKTPLMMQDRMAIGGRYTVRGFDGEMSLMAERGWYWRNEFGWHYATGQQLYLGLDAGHVSGPSAAYLLGQTLVGGVIGLRGQFKAGGQVYYDLFAGTPIKKPRHFQTPDVTLGFMVSYAF